MKKKNKKKTGYSCKWCPTHSHTIPSLAEVHWHTGSRTVFWYHSYEANPSCHAGCALFCFLSAWVVKWAPTSRTVPLNFCPATPQEETPSESQAAVSDWQGTVFIYVYEGKQSASTLDVRKGIQTSTLNIIFNNSLLFSFVQVGLLFYSHAERNCWLTQYWSPGMHPLSWPLAGVSQR